MVEEIIKLFYKLLITSDRYKRRVIKHNEKRGKIVQKVFRNFMGEIE